MNFDKYQMLLNVIDKAETGPILDENEWDKKYIGQTAQDLIEKYDISWSMTDQFIVSTDDDLADRTFEAGMELAREVGVYCVNTKRQMSFSQEELDKSLSILPQEIVVGAGTDTVTIYKRKPEEPKRVAIWGGPFGVPVAEELFIPMMESYAQEPLIDILDNVSLLTTHGRSARAGAPTEAVMGWQEAATTLELIEKAGRPGLPLGCGANATTEIGDMANTTWGGFRPSDVHKLSFVSEQKTAYHHLTKAVHFANTNSFTEIFCNTMYGGFMGGESGVALGVVAGLILLQACYLGDIPNAGPTHVHLSCSTYPGIVSAMSVAFQALSRNTNLLVAAHTRPTTGPGTRDIFNEISAYLISNVVSGASVVNCVQSAVGNNIAHASPLEVRFGAQVVHAAEGLSRKEANEIVRSLIGKFSEIQKEGRIGKTFPEVYNLDSLQPTPEWQGMYEDALEEMESEYGLKL